MYVYSLAKAENYNEWNFWWDFMGREAMEENEREGSGESLLFEKMKVYQV